MTQATQPHSSADGVAWDLGDLYASVEDPRLTEDLAAARRRAEAFETAYRGKIGALKPDQAPLLLTAVRELEGLFEQMDRPLIYASLLHAARTDDPRHGALLSRTQEERTQVNKHLIFFDLEWVALPDEIAEALTRQAVLAHYRHYLEQKRAWKPHYLSEPEEKVLDEKGVTGRSAFNRLFEESTAGLRFTFSAHGTSQSLSLQEVLAKLYDADRAVRRAAAESITAGLEGNARLLTFIFNTVVLDHDVDMRLRHFAGPMDSRNLANEISPAVVEALMTATERSAIRWCSATIASRASCSGWTSSTITTATPRSRARCRPAIGGPRRRSFRKATTPSAPTPAGSSTQFFAKRWIDAELRPSKRGGAFSSSTVPSVHPYILLNYTDRLRDVMTLAHELGHGLHQYLSRGQGYLAVRHAVDNGGDGERVRRDADLSPLAGALSRAEAAPGDAVRQDRGRVRHRLPPGGADAFRAIAAQARKEQGELSANGDQHAVDAGQPGDVRRRGRDDRGLRAGGGRTSAISSARRSTAMRMRSANCWCWRCIRSTARTAPRSCRATWSCWPRAASTRRTSCSRSSASM